jgi:hypothetical protein
LQRSIPLVEFGLVFEWLGWIISHGIGAAHESGKNELYLSWTIFLLPSQSTIDQSVDPIRTVPKVSVMNFVRKMAARNQHSNRNHNNGTMNWIFGGMRKPRELEAQNIVIDVAEPDFLSDDTKRRILVTIVVVGSVSGCGAVAGR